MGREFSVGLEFYLSGLGVDGGVCCGVVHGASKWLDYSKMLFLSDINVRFLFHYRVSQEKFGMFSGL